MLKQARCLAWMLALLQAGVLAGPVFPGYTVPSFVVNTLPACTIGSCSTAAKATSFSWNRDANVVVWQYVPSILYHQAMLGPSSLQVRQTGQHGGLHAGGEHRAREPACFCSQAFLSETPGPEDVHYVICVEDGLPSDISGARDAMQAAIRRAPASQQQSLFATMHFATGSCRNIGQDDTFRQMVNDSTPRPWPTMFRVKRGLKGEGTQALLPPSPCPPLPLCRPPVPHRSSSSAPFPLATQSRRSPASLSSRGSTARPFGATPSLRRTFPARYSSCRTVPSCAPGAQRQQLGPTSTCWWPTPRLPPATTETCCSTPRSVDPSTCSDACCYTPTPHTLSLSP
jgi:hypothetical protein